MKTTFIVLLSLCLYLLVASAEKKTDVEEAGYKGRVKSVKESNYSIIEQDGKHVRALGPVIRVDKYDEKGKVIEEAVYHRLYPDYKESLFSRTTYRYDKEGNRLEMVVYDNLSKLTSKYPYKYNEKEGKLEEVRYSPNGYKLITKYDERGNKLEEIGMRAGDRLFYKTTCKYDERGNKLEEVKYFGNGQLVHKETYKYDEKGNRLEGLWYGRPGGKLKYKHTYSYDEEKNVLEKVSYDTDIKRIKFKTTFKHDKSGNKEKETQFALKTSKGKTRYVPTGEKTREFTYWD